MARNVLPILRSSIARELVERHGLSQVEAAERLGITQPAINQYLCSKRGKRSVVPAGVARKVEKTARRAAAQIASNRISQKDVMRMTCKLCAEMKKADA